MGVSARRLQIAQQFGKEGYHVLGLQETRVRRSAQFQCEGWLVWTAVAAAAGMSGVEVWLAEHLGVNGRDVTIAVENPRYLAISVPLPGRRTLFVSAHWPPAESGEEQVRLWWSTFVGVQSGQARQGRVAQAKVGQNQSGGGHRLLSAVAPRGREGQGQLQSLQLRMAPHCWTRHR